MTFSVADLLELAVKIIMKMNKPERKILLSVQNSFWMERVVLEVEQEKPGRGPEGQRASLDCWQGACA